MVTLGDLGADLSDCCGRSVGFGKENLGVFFGYASQHVCLFRRRREAGLEEILALDWKHFFVGGEVAATLENLLEDCVGEVRQVYRIASFCGFFEVAPGGAGDLDAV